MKEELAAGLSKRQIAEFVEYDKVHAGEVIGEPPLPAGAGFALQPVYQVDDDVEAASCAAADARSCDRYGEMRFAGAGSADQDGVALLGQKGPGCQAADQALVDRRFGKGEAVEILGERQLGDGHLVLDRARLLFGDLGGEQLADDARRLVLALDRGGYYLVVSRPHAEQLELGHQLEDVAALH